MPQEFKNNETISVIMEKNYFIDSGLVTTLYFHLYWRNIDAIAKVVA
jgi:hypothetical protein